MNDCIDILLVEDDPADVRLALTVFRAMGIDRACVVANDGEDAMDFLRLFKDLVQKRLVSTATPAALGPSSDGSTRRPMVGLSPMTSK